MVREVLNDRLVVALIGGLALLVAVLPRLAPPEATPWGQSGVLTGLLGLGVGVGAVFRGRRAWRRGDRWNPVDGYVGWMVLALCALILGTATIVGNFRVARVDLTVVGTQSRGAGTRAEDLKIWTAEYDHSFRVNRAAFTEARKGGRLHCTGANPPILRTTLTQCGRGVSAR